jgi:hypothetical protein
MTLAKALQAAAGNAGGDNLYVEDVFSTYLYSGNGSTQTITNGIDLDGEGGLVWIKARGLADGTYPQDHSLIDTERGPTTALMSNTTNGNSAQEYSLGTNGTFNSNGFTIASTNNQVNNDDVTVGYASWSFRKAPKFFDVLVHTAGTSVVMNHDLGVVPGCIIVKNTGVADYWGFFHRGTNGYMLLNVPDAADGVSQPGIGSSTSTSLIGATSTTIDFSNWYNPNTNFIVYLFAHDAGGFGLSGEDNVISCGSVSGFGTVVNLGFEPQWILMKQSNGTSDWIIADNMRGIATGGNDALLFANTSGAETSANDWIDLTSTGFVNNVGSGTYIYIAIRRGPMATPTSGTEVFSPNAVSTDASPVTTNFPVDLILESPRTGAANIFDQDRLRGVNKVLYTYGADAESTAGGSDTTFQNNTSVTPNIYGSGTSLILWNFRRAPSFMDVVCYTGTGSGTTFAHNLAVVPELMIVKERSSPAGWWWNVYYGTANKFLKLNNQVQPT